MPLGAGSAARQAAGALTRCETVVTHTKSMGRVTWNSTKVGSARLGDQARRLKKTSETADSLSSGGWRPGQPRDADGEARKKNLYYPGVVGAFAL